LDRPVDERAEAARLEPGALPLLAFALDRLCTRRAGRRLVRPAVTGSTTLGAILSAYTEEVEKALPVEQREVLWQLFRHLVGVEDGGYRVAKHRSRPANIGDDATLYDSSFSLDGTRVVSAGADGTVRLWHADGAGEPVILRGHELWVRDATFSPDGTRVVSAGFDGKVRLWHADGTGEPLVLSSHEGGVNVASFSPDGTRAVSAGSDGAVRLWRIFASEHALIDAARASLPRQLTDVQRARYHLPPRGT